MTNRDLPPSYRYYRWLWTIMFVVVGCALVVGLSLLIFNNNLLNVIRFW